MLLSQDAVDGVRDSLTSFYADHPIKHPDRAFYTCTFGPGAHRESN